VGRSGKAVLIIGLVCDRFFIGYIFHYNPLPGGDKGSGEAAEIMREREV
jgi:hypothetical protein